MRNTAADCAGPPSRVRRIRAGGVAVALVGLPLAAAALTARASTPAVQSALAASRSLDDLVLATAGAALVAVLLWLTAAVATAAVEVLLTSPPLPSRRRARWNGSRSRRPMAERVSPVLVRRLVAVALGAALGSGAAAAGAAPRVPDAGWAATAPTVAGAVAAPALSAATPGAPDPAWTAVASGDLAPPLRTDGPAQAERVVHRGDSLWSIAASRLGPDASRGDVLREQERLYALNAAVVGADPDLLHPGQVLRVG